MARIGEHDEMTMKVDRTEVVTDRYTVRWLSKDGAWHVALPYTPTEQDRKYFPRSYPTGSNGSFFRWAVDCFETKAEAIRWAKSVEVSK